MKKKLALFMILALLGVAVALVIWERGNSPLEKFYTIHFSPPKQFPNAILKQLLQKYSLVTVEKKNSATPLFSVKLPIRHYTVQVGDTLWDIAKKFALNIDTIVSYNPSLKVHLIRPGIVLKIPPIDGILIPSDRAKKFHLIAEDFKLSPHQRKQLFFFNTSSPKKKSAFFVPGAYFKLEERMEFLGAEFIKPLKNIRITSLYGHRIHPLTKKRSFHKGVDMGGTTGDIVYAAKGGTVIYAGKQSGYGFIVIMRHQKGYISKYAHLSQTLVKVSQKVATSQIIGKIGNTGNATGPHLHFEIWKNRQHINPLDVSNLY